jgi:hypothetical protein
MYDSMVVNTLFRFDLYRPAVVSNDLILTCEEDSLNVVGEGAWNEMGEGDGERKRSIEVGKTRRVEGL